MQSNPSQYAIILVVIMYFIMIFLRMDRIEYSKVNNKIDRL
jgi:hypothetical protein